MPGSISDSYDPEFGTSANSSDINEAVQRMHSVLGNVIGSPPKFIVEVVHGDDGDKITASLSEKEWRILRFACERSQESL